MEFFMICFAVVLAIGGNRASSSNQNPHRPSSSRHLLLIRKYFIIVFVKKFSGVLRCSKMFPRSWFQMDKFVILPTQTLNPKKCSTLVLLLLFYHSREESRVERWWDFDYGTIPVFGIWHELIIKRRSFMFCWKLWAQSLITPLATCEMEMHHFASHQSSMCAFFGDTSVVLVRGLSARWNSKYKGINLYLNKMVTNGLRSSSS
jgi:hypothetical protein